MIGKIFLGYTSYYDLRARRIKQKTRPFLIIGGPRNDDYTVLPVSTISKRENLDFEYDVEIIPANYSLLSLDKVSYVRTHKQTTIHKAELLRELSDLKENYPDLYLEILEKHDKFQRELTDNALI